MKNRIKKYFMSLLLTCLVSSLAFSQKCIIQSTNQALKISGKRFLSSQIHKIPVDDTATITASDGLVSFQFSYANESGHVKLENGKSVRVQNLLNSSYCQLDQQDSYISMVSGLLNWFMKISENPVDYYHRVGPEKGGTRRDLDSVSNYLQSRRYKTNLRKNDEIRLTQIQDSLEKKGITDSVAFYLYAAIFLEQQRYYSKANVNYGAAYRYTNTKGNSSKVIRLIYQQFLYRMGMIEQGNALK